MSDGWVKIHRGFQEWEWYDKSEMVHLFLHLLITANSSDRQWHGIEIKRGQLVTSLQSLQDHTGLSIRTLRTCLSKLVETGEIEREATNKFSLITICNYETYQDENFESDKQATSKSQTVAKVTKPKKTKEEVIADTNKRKNEFYNSLIPFVEKFGKEMVRQFYDFWSELNKFGSKMRWEQEPTWELEKRLDYWSRRDRTFNKTKSNADNRTNNESAEQRAEGAANLVARLLSENKPSE